MERWEVEFNTITSEIKSAEGQSPDRKIMVELDLVQLLFLTKSVIRLDSHEIDIWDLWELLHDKLEEYLKKKYGQDE